MLIDALINPKSVLSRALDALQPAFALGSRIYVSWVFLKSGYLKVSDWDSTVALFEYEYHVPLLPPTPSRRPVCSWSSWNRSRGA